MLAIYLYLAPKQTNKHLMSLNDQSSFVKQKLDALGTNARLCVNPYLEYHKVGTKYYTAYPRFGYKLEGIQFIVTAPTTVAKKLNYNTDDDYHAAFPDFDERIHL